jgi:catalase
VPEELIKPVPVGRLVLNRNPDNFFAETEQVAFCAAHIVPGIDFSNDPLLQGRIHSYVDTQISRLGGPNFHEIPVNAPIAQVHNNQRDGMHRQAINRGRVAYEPNSLGGGCPFQAGMKSGFASFPEPLRDDKVRGKPEKFADHFTQARLFWESQSDVEKRHIIRGFRFELTKVQIAFVRERIVSLLANVADELAAGVAEGIGIDVPEPQPKVLARPAKPEVTVSKRLSLFARPGDGSIRTRRIAILVADGVDGEAATTLHEGLLKAGAVPRLVGARLGQVETEQGEALEVEVTLEAAPSVLWDAVAVPGGHQAVERLANIGHAVEFIENAYRHCKPLLAIGAGSTLLDGAGAATHLPDGDPDPGVLSFDEGEASQALREFTAAIAQHRHFARESDPPMV